MPAYAHPKRLFASFLKGWTEMLTELESRDSTVLTVHS